MYILYLKKFAVHAASSLHQVVVVATLNNLAIFENGNDVRVANSG
jgi:hypothetical protein